jgi:Spy/CpxP family protein refolding chaperone
MKAATAPAEKQISMKTTKHVWMAVLALGSLTAFSPLTQAADEKPATPPAGRGQGERGQMMRERVQRISEELKLTDQQKEKVRAVFQEEMEKGRAVREDTSLSQEDRRAKRQKIREDMTAKMKGILTAEQWEKWQKMREEQRGQMQQRRGPGGPGGQGAGQGRGPASPPPRQP